MGPVPFTLYRLRMWEGLHEDRGRTLHDQSHMLTAGDPRPSVLPLHSRQKIFKEKALPDIENYMFENHDQLRQAATECMCNMVLNKEVRLGLRRTG